MKIGDVISNSRYGVDGTGIPAGAVVRYSCDVSPNGVSGPTWVMNVIMYEGKKMLSFPGQEINRSFGQNGTMEIISLPEGFPLT